MILLVGISSIFRLASCRHPAWNESWMVLVPPLPAAFGTFVGRGSSITHDRFRAIVCAIVATAVLFTIHVIGVVRYGIRRKVLPWCGTD